MLGSARGVSIGRDMAMVVVPALLLLAGLLWVALQFVQPAPPKTISITTGSETGAYYAFGQKYAASLAKSGIKLEVLPSKGSVENLQRVKDPAAHVQLALLQGGIVDTPAAGEGLVSLGRMFVEPLWVFHRLPGRIGRLGDLKGTRLAIGGPGSGTRKLSEALLGANHISDANTTFLPVSGQAAIDAMRAGEADAIFLSFAPEAPIVQGLLRDPNIKLMSFDQAEAYARLFPFLQRIVLPRGVVDLAAGIPADDIVLVAPKAALVAREDLHPALVALMVDAAQEAHGVGGMFQHPGDFPLQVDSELRMSDDALRTYKSGQPVLRRYLPFWLAVFMERSMVMLLPIVTVMIPLMKFLPQIYQWRIRRRIYYWYGQLKRLEWRVTADRLREHAVEHRDEIERIDEAVSLIPVPDRFAEQLYDLRAAVDLVRQRLVARERSAPAAPAASQGAPADAVGFAAVQAQR